MVPWGLPTSCAISLFVYPCKAERITIILSSGSSFERAPAREADSEISSSILTEVSEQTIISNVLEYYKNAILQRINERDMLFIIHLATSEFEAIIRKE